MNARDMWLRKLEHLREEDAKCSDPNQRFTIRESIREAEENLARFDSGEPSSDASLPHEDSPAAEPRRVRWGDELRIYGEGFAGRRAELRALDEALNGGRVRVYSLWAEGGTGKTRLLFQFLNQVRDDGWRGLGHVFVHSFYSQGSDDRRSASSDVFFEQALAHFGYRGGPILDATEQGRKLAELVIRARGLLVLDGLEPLQHPPQHAERGQLKAPAIRALLLALANAGTTLARSASERGNVNSLAGASGFGEAPLAGAAGLCGGGLCLVTSRQEVVELRGRTGAAVVQQPLDRLDVDDGVELLRQLEIHGPETGLRAAVEDYRGHAYSLMLLGTYLRDATRDHDIRQRHEIPLLDEDQEHRYHARHMFAAYVRHLGEASPEVAVLRLLGFFDRPAAGELMDVLRAREGVVYEWPEGAKRPQATERPKPQRIADSLPDITGPLLDLSPAAWQRVLRRLSDLRLISIKNDSSAQQASVSSSPSLDSHPLLREYFAEQLRGQVAWLSRAVRDGVGTVSRPVPDGSGEPCHAEAWQAGHRRLYEHLTASVPYWPEGIEGLQPLYQAVAHGREAGQQQACVDVYQNRILRGSGSEGFYSSKKLGAIGADLGAAACFFDRPWSRVSPNLSPADQAWVLNQAGLRLRALGRLTEAAEPLRAALEIRIQQQVWKSAAIIASNLSELELTLGDVSAAVADSQHSVTFADNSEDAYRQMARRTTHADALHQAGRRDEAERLFREAEAMQAKRQPQHLRLCALRGVRYCDLLLSAAERAAWQVALLPSLTRDPTGGASANAPIGDLSRALPVGSQLNDLAASCADVTSRASEALEIVKSGSGNLLDVALHHLTLARAGLYGALLHVGESHRDLQPVSERPAYAEARRHLAAAVDGLRQAGAINHLPRGLLTLSWFRFVEGDVRGCEDALAEAWEIAERGPMPLFQADIHLTRARLCRDRAALAEARRLIEKHGYHRRDEELADAEAALGMVPATNHGRSDATQQLPEGNVR